MTLKAAFWTSGNAVRSTETGLWLSEHHAGWGTHFKTSLGPENPANPTANAVWFHMPLTTPVIVDGVRPSLTKVFMCYKTMGNAKIKAIHVWDGSTRISTFDGLSCQGDHPQTALDVHNSWQISPAVIVRFGLDVSALVWFGFTEGGVVPEIVFYTGGADFVTS